MNDKVFDDFLKSSLENLEAPYDPASWSALEQRMSGSVPDDAPSALDQTMAQALAGLEVPYRSAHWDLMAERLNDQARRRRRVWISKLAEAAIFILLLANLDGFLADGITPSSAPGAAKAGEPVAVRPSTPGRSTAIPGAGAASTLQEGAGFWTANSGSEGQFSDVSDGMDPQVRNASDITYVGPACCADSLVTEEAPVRREFVANYSGTALPSLLDPLPGLTTNLPLAKALDPLHYPFIIIKSPRQRHIYASVSAGYDKNYIRSETDLRSGKGYEAGVNVGYRKGKWGLETGLSYSKKTYQPKREVEIYGGNVSDGYYGSYAEKVSADLVSVPVKASRRMASLGKTTVHATAGVTANFAVQKDFRYQKVYYPGISASPPGHDNQQPQLQKDGVGIVENGKFSENFYATADLGMRIERPVGRRLTAFVEPVYRTALGGKGIGPKASKINTMAVQAGVMASL